MSHRWPSGMPRTSGPSAGASARKASCQAAHVRVVVAVHLAVRGDRGRLLLPFMPGGRVSGERAEGCDGPGRRVLGGELAEALLAVVHHCRDLVEVHLAFGVGQDRHPLSSWALWLR